MRLLMVIASDSVISPRSVFPLLLFEQVVLREGDEARRVLQFAPSWPGSSAGAKPAPSDVSPACLGPEQSPDVEGTQGGCEGHLPAPDCTHLEELHHLNYFLSAGWNLD